MSGTISSHKKTGIMGGTFNPIHVGHLMLAEWAMEAAQLDEIIFIPTGYSYMKEEAGILGGSERLELVKLAIFDRNEFSSSDMEISRGGNTYTYETMDRLCKENQDTEFYFICGADCLFTMEEWAHVQKIFQSCVVIAAARNGSSIEEMEQKRRELEVKYGARIMLLSFLAMEISSTEIRERIHDGKSIRYLVPEKVRKYIEEHHIYEDD